MAFYFFSQNNSGGRFRVSKNVAACVYVEASSAEQANHRAEALGLYFDGSGDCECCGSRWDEASEGAFSKAESLTSSLGDLVRFGWGKSVLRENDKNGCRVHFEDGRKLSGSVLEVLQQLENEGAK